MPSTSLNFIGSKNAPNFMRSVTGMARGGHYGPDIQVAAAILKRVGLGKLISFTGSPYELIYPTGPVAWTANYNSANPIYTPPLVNNTVDPLYLICTIKLAWTGGPTLNEVITYDPTYGDMTDICDEQGDLINVASDWNPRLAFGSTPIAPPPPGVSYDTYGTYSQSVDITGLIGTMAWSGGTDGTTVWLPQTLTYTLSSIKHYSDYVTLCDANLATLTTGSDITLFTGSEVFGGGSDFKWTWIKGFQIYGTITDSNLTNSVAAVVTRSGGVQYRPLTDIISSAPYMSGSVNNDNGNYISFNYNPYAGANTLPHIISGPPTYKSIISAYGCPMEYIGAVGYSLIRNADNDLEITGSLAGYIMCLKTTVRNNTPMGMDFKAVTYAPATNSVSVSYPTPGGLPSSNSTTDFYYSILGYQSCPYIEPVSIQPMVWAYPPPSAQFNIVQLSGSPYPLTVYAIPLDKFGNAIEPTAATWSLINKTGGVVDGDLVAASDGRTAVYSGAHTGTCKIQCAVTGLISIPSATVTTP